MKEVKSITWSSKQLLAMYNKETIRFDAYVQRNECWGDKRKSLLIRTMLNGFPRIPEIYATRDTESKVYQGLDGKQRLTTVFHFMNDEFALCELKPIVDDDGNVYELSGKKFIDLPEELKDIILTYSWRIAYYDDLDDDDIAELFFLTNNGKPLSGIEHSRVISPSLSTIQEIGKHELFNAALTEKAFERYTHEDIVIKSYIMLTMENPCLDTKVVRPTLETAVLNEEDMIILNKVFDRILHSCNIILETTNENNEKVNKKIAKRLLTRTHLLSIIPIVKKSIDDGVSEDKFADWVKQFFNGAKSPTNYEMYNSRCTSGSGHAESVKIRLEIIESDFNNFLGTVDMNE